MSRRVAVVAVGATATALTLLAAILPADALAVDATARQLAGAIPRPYVGPKTAVRAGGNLFVLDGDAIGRVDLATSDYAVFAGRRTRSGAVDGIGGAARFNQPWGLATDGTNLYVADTGNDTIRKVVLATAEVTTIAGAAGQAGSVDGIGTAARFDQPWGIAVGSIKLYVTDRGNNTVRKLILATGQVKTAAGTAGQTGSADGIGAAARFGSLGGIVHDGPNVWIADGDRVRKFVPSTGWVTTTTTVSCGFLLKQLVGIAFVNGTLYVTADCEDDEGEAFNALFVVDPTTGAVSNGPDIGYRDSVGLGADATNLYVTGFGTFFPSVYRLDPVTGTGAEVGGYFEDAYADGVGAAARFDFAGAIVRAGPRLYVEDRLSEAIRVVTIATGEVTTLTTGVSGGNGTGLARSGASLYVNRYNTIQRVDIATGAVTPFATIGGPGGSINGIVTDGVNLYAAFKCAIYKVSLATAATSVLAGSPNICGYVDGTGGTARFGSSPGIYGPTDLAILGPNLWVADSFNYHIRKVVIPTGQVTTLHDFRAADERPDGITAAGATVYAIVGQSIQAVSIATGAVTPVAGKPVFPLTYGGSPAARTEIVEPQRLVADPDGGRIFFTHRTGVAVIE